MFDCCLRVAIMMRGIADVAAWGNATCVSRLTHDNMVQVKIDFEFNTSSFSWLRADVQNPYPSVYIYNP